MVNNQVRNAERLKECEGEISHGQIQEPHHVHRLLYPEDAKPDDKTISKGSQYTNHRVDHYFTDV